MFLTVSGFKAMTLNTRMVLFTGAQFVSGLDVELVCYGFYQEKQGENG